MTVNQLQNLLKRYNLSPNKTFGQNFLLDDEVIDAIVAAAGIQPGETVLEVGPGIGNWTARLAQAADAVLAVEKDTRFQPLLLDLVKRHPNVLLEFADILSFDFVSALSQAPYRVVANLPYYLTGAAFQLFLRASQKPRSMTVLVQKEVANNAVAVPGRSNLLSLSVRLIGVPQIIRVIPAQSIYPAPKVDSSVLHITIPEQPLYPDVDEQAFFRVARACFAGKRKQIHNTLTANLRLSADAVTQALSHAGIDEKIRPQELGVEEFITLSKTIATNDKNEQK
jgi:16S rRNA (adenine1518-N6/adenine1519-N6)-dimethyltransferase